MLLGYRSKRERRRVVSLSSGSGQRNPCIRRSGVRVRAGSETYRPRGWRTAAVGASGGLPLSGRHVVSSSGESSVRPVVLMFDSSSKQLEQGDDVNVDVVRLYL